MKTVRPTNQNSQILGLVLILTAFGLASQRTFAQAVCAPPPTGLVSWWQLEGNAGDFIGTNAATLAGSASFATGEVGLALTMDGSHDYGVIPASPSLDVGAADGLTIEAWINPSDISQLRPMAEWNDGAGNIGTLFWISVAASFAGGPGSLFGSIGDLSGGTHQISTTTGLLTANVFQHVALTYDKPSGATAIYLNGSPVAQTNLGSFTPQTRYPLYLGLRPSGPFSGIYFKGKLDEVGLYNRALSAGEVQSIFIAGSAGKCVSPTAPLITTQPHDQAVFVGQSASFSVIASGTAPITNQWYFNTNTIPDGTNTTLLISNTSSNDAGAYFVIVANAFGSVTSSLATLEVKPLPPCAQPATGLVSWWPLDGDADDTIGTNRATLFGSPLFDAGEVRQGLSFDGVNDYAKVAASPSLNAGAGDGLTVEVWINPADVAHLRPIVEWNSGAGSIGTLFWVAVPTSFGGGPGSLFGSVGDLSGGTHQISTATGLLATNVFQHVALTYDKASGAAAIYLNGVPVAQTNLGSFTPQTSYPLYFGLRPSGPFSGIYFKGIMDEVGLYSRALTATEIQAIFDTGAGGKCTTPMSPYIAAEPQSRTNVVGENAVFTVVATGSRPLEFQWGFNGVPVDAATNATLTLSNLQPAQAGDYSVVVANSSGSVTSQVATLTLLPSRTLSLDSPPASQEGTGISVPMQLISDGDVGGMTFVFRYNSNYLRDAELVWSPLLDGLFNTVNYSTPGEIQATFALSGNTVPAGTQLVATVNFLLRSVPNDLDTALALQILDVSSPLGDPISLGNLTQGGSAHITKRVIIGDNNANQRLDVGDATVILRFLTHLDTPRSWDITGNDLNSNQNLDSGDALKILRVAAGIDPQPGGGVGAAPQLSSRALKSASLPVEFMLLSPVAQRGNAGDAVTFQVQLQNVSTPVSGASFTLDFPTNALRLANSQAYKFGPLVPGGALAVWNISPAQANFALQDGHLSVAVSSATAWPASNGVLAEITFQVQPSAANRYLWPLVLRSAEITPDGYRNRFLLPSGAVFFGRNPLPGFLSATGRSPSGQFQFTLNGDAGASYGIEVSTDLLHWSPRTNLVNIGGLLQFIDADSTNFPHRYYRTVLTAP